MTGDAVRTADPGRVVTFTVTAGPSGLARVTCSEDLDALMERCEHGDPDQVDAAAIAMWHGLLFAQHRERYRSERDSVIADRARPH